jgi:hypothetical protein
VAVAVGNRLVGKMLASIGLGQYADAFAAAGHWRLSELLELEEKAAVALARGAGMKAGSAAKFKKYIAENGGPEAAAAVAAQEEQKVAAAEAAAIDEAKA